MVETCFLGANTPQGFRSEYKTLQQDPRIRRLLILKGGPGCGKSTLMKTLGNRAEECGWKVERILCSSDPDSLDGVLVPELGLALTDGTAPHVVEPTLCGCGENYVNLGRCYREAELRALAPAIRATREANLACYGPVYGCLRAVASLAEARRGLLGQERIRDVTKDALEQLLPEKLPKSDKQGTRRRVYFSGITPKGLLTLDPGVERLWAIHDSSGVGGGLLRQIEQCFIDAREDVILGMDPLNPDAVEAVIVPARDLGWIRVRPSFQGCRQAMLRLDLDSALEEELPAETLEGLRELASVEACLLRQSVGWLRRAKSNHDLMEELYRPAVDFAAVTRETELLCRELFTEN